MRKFRVLMPHLHFSLLLFLSCSLSLLITYVYLIFFCVFNGLLEIDTFVFVWALDNWHVLLGLNSSFHLQNSPINNAWTNWKIEKQNNKTTYTTIHMANLHTILMQPQRLTELASFCVVYRKFCLLVFYKLLIIVWWANFVILCVILHVWSVVSSILIFFWYFNICGVFYLSRRRGEHSLKSTLCFLRPMCFVCWFLLRSML